MKLGKSLVNQVGEALRNHTTSTSYQLSLVLSLN